MGLVLTFLISFFRVMKEIVTSRRNVSQLPAIIIYQRPDVLSMYKTFLSTLSLSKIEA